METQWPKWIFSAYRKGSEIYVSIMHHHKHDIIIRTGNYKIAGEMYDQNVRVDNVKSDQSLIKNIFTELNELMR